MALSSRTHTHISGKQHKLLYRLKCFQVQRKHGALASVFSHESPLSGLNVFGLRPSLITKHSPRLRVLSSGLKHSCFKSLLFLQQGRRFSVINGGRSPRKTMPLRGDLRENKHEDSTLKSAIVLSGQVRKSESGRKAQDYNNHQNTRFASKLKVKPLPCTHAFQIQPSQHLP